MTNPHAGRGNRNAAKPPSQRRVALSLRVNPETRARLESMAQTHGSMSRAVDHVVAVSKPVTAEGDSPATH